MTASSDTRRQRMAVPSTHRPQQQAVYQVEQTVAGAGGARDAYHRLVSPTERLIRLAAITNTKPITDVNSPTAVA